MSYYRFIYSDKCIIKYRNVYNILIYLANNIYYMEREREKKTKIKSRNACL